MLILSAYIAKHEMRPLLRHIGIDDVLEGGRKVLKNLAQELRPHSQARESRFFKVRIGQHASARMIVFMVVGKSDIIPALLRLKSDKVFGMNMAMNNPSVVKQLEKNFAKVREDIETGRFQHFEIDF